MLWNNDYNQDIVHFRDLDAHALIGNLGGYVGLLLGFSILQLPNILRNLFKNMHNFWRDDANLMVSKRSRDLKILVGERITKHDVY